MPGPMELRFRTYLQGAHDATIDGGADEWDRCAELLDIVATAMDDAASRDRIIGGATGPAMGRAFTKTSKGMRDKADVLRTGRDSLTRAARVVRQAQQAQRDIDAESPDLPQPGAYRAPVGPPTPADLKRQRTHDGEVRRFNDNRQAREDTATLWTERMDQVFTHEVGVMKGIHGEPDTEPIGMASRSSEPPAANGAGGSGPRIAGAAPGTPHGGPVGTPVAGPTHQPSSPTPTGNGNGSHPTGPTPGTPQGPGPAPTPGMPQGHGPGYPSPAGPLTPSAPSVPAATGASSGSVPAVAPSASGGATAGAVAAGLGAGGAAAGLGAIRSGSGALAGTGSTSSGVRPIGATGRATGATGALGRGASTGAVPTSRGATSGRGAAGTTGRGATGRGAATGGTGTRGAGSGSGKAGARSAAGTRGTAGGRGAGAGSAARSGAAKNGAGKGAAGNSLAGKNGAGRGGAGRGAGTGGVAGRRTGRDEESQGRDRDLFDDGSDWIDDEGIAPEVLD